MKKAAAVSEVKRLALCRWIQTMELDHNSRLLFRGPEKPAQGRKAPYKFVAPFDATVEARDIRLLSPDLSPDVGRPIYFAVLSRWDNRTFLMAPFSPYPIAATDSELLVDLAQNLEVLCLWNARTVATDILARSWLVDRLPTKNNSDAWKVFRHAMTGATLPAELANRVGLPVYRPEDPRVAYQLEEAEGLQFLVEESEKVLQG